MIPEVEEPMSVVAGAKRSISASTLCLSSVRSGTFSCTRSAWATASARSSVTRQAWRSAPSVRPRLTSEGQAMSIICVRRRAAASTSVSKATTSAPAASARTAQPQPMTPLPTMATRAGTLTGLPSDSVIKIVLFCAFQAKMIAGFLRGHHTGAQRFDDADRLGYQAGIVRLDPAGKIKIVFQADPAMAARHHGLRHHRHLHATNAERSPVSVFRQPVAHGEQGARLGLGTPRNAQAKLEQRIAVNQSFLNQLAGEPDMTQVKAFQLRLHTGLLHQCRMFAQPVGTVDVNHVPEIEAAAIQRADFRQQFANRRVTFGWGLQI